jgi:hypothetical protein
MTPDNPLGKNFSGNNLGQRRKADLYETPYSITAQLLAAEPFDKSAPTLEPACGKGAITRVLEANGFEAVESYDLERNFLLEQRTYPQIITNPPFSQALAFIFAAKRQCSDRFAFLLPLSYLHGKTRLEVYCDRSFPLARVHVFCRYPMLGDPLREDGRYRTGMMVYAWFIWEKGWKLPPQIHWIDNHRYVLGAKGVK